jgi:aryl-alcohol dehydrogenase-like predicted oxidoreductase
MPTNPFSLEMPYRDLGRTGERVSAIGLGGFHLGKPDLSDSDAARIIHAALERGINFLDNSWDYNEGESERRVGNAIQGIRDRVFVMTKFDGRTKVSALQQLDDSLRRLKVECIDLWQFHENNRLEDPDRFFAPGGAVEAVVEARQAGKIRYVGFTGHKDPLVHIRMLEAADLHGFRFDTVQMPLNVMDAHFRSFEKHVLPLLVQRKMGVLGMKSIGDKQILKSKVVTPLECLCYALSLPTSVVITGIDSMMFLEQAFEAIQKYRSWTSSDIQALLARTRDVASKGEFEPFKTTEGFDATAFHPEWLGNQMVA